MAIARVKGEHTMVDIFLDTGTAVTRCQRTARGAGDQASLDALSLSVGGNILDNDTPFAFDVHSTDRTGVKNIAGTDVAFATDPVTLVIRLAVVRGIIELVLFRRGDAINQIIS